MKLCSVSRFFPAITGMAIRALSLVRQQVAAGHDVTMVGQNDGEPDQRRVHGSGLPAPAFDEAPPLT